MAHESSQRTDYEKKGGSKVESSGKLDMISAGGTTGDTGPTGSSRHYPKGKGSPHRTDWNPQKLAASTYGICGVGHD